MCGIIGYTGTENAVPIIVTAERLEYRGYDSAGVAVMNEDGFEAVKQKGCLSALKHDQHKPIAGFMIGIPGGLPMENHPM